MPKAKRKSNPEVPTGNLEGDQTHQVEVDREEPGPPSAKEEECTLARNPPHASSKSTGTNCIIAKSQYGSTSADGTLTAQASTLTPPTSLTTWASFRLSEFDPDKSDFTIEEWLGDASKLK
jgi:hypothetical protein